MDIKISSFDIPKSIKNWFDFYKFIGIDINQFVEKEKSFDNSIIDRFNTSKLLMNESTINNIQSVLQKNNAYRKRNKQILNLQSSFDYISYSPKTDNSIKDNILHIED